MSDTLYIQTDENMEVHHPHVYLQDIVKLSCSNSKILNRLRVLPVASLDPKRPGRYVLSAMDLIREIQKKEPDLEITHIGEPSFIITYQTKPNTSTAWCWCKVIFVCLASFFGAAFSIMTFANKAEFVPGYKGVNVNDMTPPKLKAIGYSNLHCAYILRLLRLPFRLKNLLQGQI